MATGPVVAFIDASDTEFERFIPDIFERPDD